ncbi:MAG: inositol-3-phosphate synthase [Paludisphaera borealis]|uniref:inositol-3-phosphate synthase n=1 Tax=Paludisphaera borealis TaxID=1387353 RepID=UPI0028491982|nr:inositol-3-phosphate synthase [Paludisphaera borealis]MDR3623016.1 inositol-3-phosphate synthase [Paludisphaera borealis]
MARRRVGLWLVGAFGGVGTTITLGLATMARGLVDQTGLVTDLPDFRELSLPEPGDFVVGGHEIRRTTFEESAEEFRRNTGVFDASWLSACRDDLAAASSRVRPGPKLGLGPAIARLADWETESEPVTARQAIDRIKADIAAFVKAEKIDHLIVLNVASTEAPFGTGEPHQTLAALNGSLSRTDALILPASSHYALAALEEGHTYLNFTPSLGASFPAAWELAETTGSLFGGKDGKTGETLMKTVLAPMFAARNFKVMSWVGHNIFGNRDGVVLDDPKNKSSKVETKDKVITEILGYKPASVVSIEYVPDMGDWKTAWDHIHFKGFLGTKMVLQFIWQGCDSLLAAPLGVDLARLADLEKQRGGKGLMRHLSCFFKGPEGDDENDFFKQYARLEEYVASLRAKAK